MLMSGVNSEINMKPKNKGAGEFGRSEKVKEVSSAAAAS